jgi:hypothetical protein
MSLKELKNHITLWYFLSRGKFAFANRLSFQAQIEDLDLKCCILGKNPKNNISGSNASLSVFTHAVKKSSSYGYLPLD